MASVKIQCPTCHRNYTVAEKLLGKKVTCSNESCGTKFVAESYQPPDTAEERSSNRESSPSTKPRTESVPSNAAAPPSKVTSTEAKSSQRRTIILTLLATIPSVLLCVGLLLYWFDTPRRQAPNNGPSIEKNEARAAAAEAIEETDFRKRVVQSLFVTHLMVQDITQDPYAEFRLNNSDGLNMLRRYNTGHVPPATVSIGKEIMKQLGDIEASLQRANDLVPKPRRIDGSKDRMLLLEELRSRDTRGPPDEIIQVLDHVTQTANKIAEKLDIGFDEAHRSERFRVSALAAISKAREHVEALNQLPPEPTFEADVKRPISMVHWWANIPEAPREAAGREQLVSALASISNDIVTAERIHNCIYAGSKVLTKDDIVTLRKRADDAVRNALKTADEIEPLLKKE